MKKVSNKRILAAVLALCMAFLCTACGGDVSLKAYSRSAKYEDPYPVLKAVEKIPDLLGLNFEEGAAEILVFSDDTSLHFYNANTNTLFATMDAETVEDYTFFTVGEYTFTAVKVSDSRIFLYEPTGKIVAMSEAYVGDIKKAAAVYEDLLAFDGKIYRIDEKGGVAASYSCTVPKIDFLAEGYYYAIESDTVTVLNKELEEVLRWENPNEDLKDNTAFRIGSSVFVQSLVPQADSAAEYDYMEDGIKYCLESWIVNAQTGEVKTAELDYYIVSADAEDPETGKGLNYATVAYVQDQKLLKEAPDCAYVVINDKTGEIEGKVFPELQGEVTMLTKKRFLYEKADGSQYLLNEKGDVVKQVDELFTASERVATNGKYIVLDSGIYNYDMELVYDYAAEEMIRISVLGHGALFKGADKAYYIYTKTGKLKNLGEADNVSFCCNQFVVLRNNNRNYIYNENGLMIGTGGDSLWVSQIGSYREFSIIAITEDDTIVYYKVF